MCVASATAEPLIQACLARLGVLHRADFTTRAKTLQTRQKARAEDLLRKRQALGGQTEQVAVCEDAAINTLETAHKAGFYTVAVFDQSNANQRADCLKIADESIINKEE